MSFEFVSREPTGELARFVETIWFAHGRIDYRRERVAPTGSTVAMVVLGDPIRQVPDDGEGEPFEATTGLLAGPHDRPVINEPRGVTHCVGIVSSPVGCEALFGVMPATIRARVVDLEPVWPAARPLRSRLLGCSTAEQVLDATTRGLESDVDSSDGRLQRCRTAVAALADDPTRPVADIAREVGISHGHLDREFVRVVGLTPRMLARILRMRRLLSHIDVFGTVEWTRLAADLGWFDQAHLIRDFRRHTGVTPSAYVEAHRRSFEPGEAAAGFVPEVVR